VSDETGRNVRGVVVVEETTTSAVVSSVKRSII
jgi:hypothetical protein